MITKPKRSLSLGALRRANKTKPKSPDLTGQLKLQRHTAAAILEEFSHEQVEEVVCNIAAWKNQDYNGAYLTVQLSPRFFAKAPTAQEDIIDAIINDKEENIDAI
jgi:hypothetical protein